MAQFERPDSDVAAGAWTTTPLWSKLDETAYDEVDYIQLNNSASSTCEIGLSNVTDPALSTGHTIRLRVKKTGTGTISLNVFLFQGATQKATFTATLTTSYADQTYTLTAGEADSITDYTDLRLKFTGVCGASGRYVFVAWAEFEVPDVVTTRSVNVNDNVGSSDAPTVATLLNGISVSDSTKVTDTVPRNIEYITVTDVASAATSAPQVNKSETVSVSDTVAVAIGTLLIDKNESVGTSDTVNAAVSTLQINVSDTTSVSDIPGVSLAGVAAYDVNVSEAGIGVSDTVVVNMTRLVNVSETSIGTVETVNVSSSALQINVSEASIGVADSVSVSVIAIGTLTVNVTDGTSPSETVLANVSTSQIDKSESIGITESVAGSVSTSQINVSDTTSIADTVEVFLGTPGQIDINKTENVNVGETITATVSSPQVDRSDTTGISEQITVSVSSLNISVSDSSNVSDTVLMTPVGLNIDKAESISVSESLLLDTPLYIVINDNVFIVEDYSLASQLFLSVADSVLVTEYVEGTISNYYYISVSDNVAVTEQVTLTMYDRMVQLHLWERSTGLDIDGRNSQLWLPVRSTELDLEDR